MSVQEEMIQEELQEEDVLSTEKGEGKVWFDNVTLEEIGTAQRILQRNDFHPPLNERDARFAAFWKDYDPLK